MMKDILVVGRLKEGKFEPVLCSEEGINERKKNCCEKYGFS